MPSERKFGSGLLLLLLIGLLSLPLHAQEVSGSINGVATDETGALLPGVTVTVTNSATGRSLTTQTAGDGSYNARALQPGRYTVKFELPGFAPAQYPDVNLLVGQTITVNAKLRVGGVETQVQVTEVSPLIDVENTVIAHNVTADEFDRLPKGRSFQGLLVTSPSVMSGQDQFGNVIGLEGGLQVNGASAAENQFVIDGVSTNSALYGQSRQNATFEFLQEVQVKTGGMEAEYGGALGGVLSAVTRSGGNNFHGEAHYYFSGDAISANSVKRLLNPLTVGTDGFNTIGSGGFVQDAKQPDRRHEFGGSLGGPFVRNKAWFFVSASPQFRRRELFYNLTDGTDTVKVRRFDQQAFAKVSYEPVSRMRANVSWLWTPTVSTGNPLAYNTGPNGRGVTVAANQVNKEAGFFQTQSNYTGNIDITLSSRMLLSARGGRFWDNYKGTGIPKITQVEYQTSTSNLSPDLLATVPPNLRGGLGFSNTPRLQLTDHDLVTRTFANVDYTVTGSLWGSHDVKTGWGITKNVNNVDVSYPNGGYVFVFWGQSFRSAVSGAPCNLNPCSGTYGYYEVDDNGTRGSTGGTIHSFYIQDKWTIQRRLTLSLGLRFEDEKVPSFRRAILDPAFEFGFGDKVMPRLGFAYDLFGNGRAKVSASWGRVYDWVKYELSRGTFGGDIWTTRYRSLDTPNVFSLSAQNMPGRDLWDERVPNSFQDHRVPSFSKDCSAQNLSTCQIDPSLKPMGTDLLNVSLEYQLGRTVFRAGYVRNSLLQAIEDMGVLIEGSENYLYVNPGKGLLGQVMNITPGTTTKAPESLCRARLTGTNLQNCLAGKVFPTPKAVRNYNAVELSATRRFAQGWFLNASYVYSRLYGNYPGLASTDEIRTPTVGGTYGVGQQQAGQLSRPGSAASRAWDLDELMFDAKGNLDILGRLATDRPHQLKVYGSYNFRFGTEVGAFFNASSGTPVTTYAFTTDRIPVRVNGRGDLGRTPVLSQTDLVVAHTVNVAESKKLRLEFNMVNLFNQKTARHIFNCVNYDCINGQVASGMNLAGVNLFQGYDYNALIRQSNNGQAYFSGTPGALNPFDPRYKKEDLFNPGFAARFGVKFSF
jgi:hypothetical protein